MNSFYNQQLAKELLSAKQRGVKIRLVLDLTQSRRMPLMKFFKENEFDFRVLPGRTGHPYGETRQKTVDLSTLMNKESKGSMMHNKYAIFDGTLLEMGSFNWSNNAEYNNFENANFIDDPRDVATYQTDFERLYKKAKPVSASFAMRTP